MKNRRTIGIVVLVVAMVVGGYYGIRALSADGNGELKASGTIEATTVNVSPELAGKVQAVGVAEGQSVQAGDVLFRLDDTLLSAQHQAGLAALQMAQTAGQTAQAAYASAQAQYQLVQTQARAQARPTRLSEWSGKTPGYFDQPMWYFTQDEQLTAAQAEVSAAQAGEARAQAALESTVADLKNAQFVAAEQRLVQARVSYLVALQVYGEGQSVGSKVAPSDLDLRAMGLCVPTPKGQTCGIGYGNRIQIAKAISSDQTGLFRATQDAYNLAKAELEDAQNAYDELLTTKQAQAVLDARAALAVAQERYQVAQERVSSLQTGDLSPQVKAAAAQVEQARNAAQQAQDAVAQAQANVTLLEAQLGKLEVKAPMEGVILTRNIEPGEYVAPGAAALTMGNLSQLTITVYVPEDRYGQIHLGQAASVKVDSFPSETFAGSVSSISNQAEFTPRNVQTVEGRSSTVYAVKLTVSDPQGKLKPGMPADVTFGK